jgi:hypothetical protein
MTHLRGDPACEYMVLMTTTNRVTFESFDSYPDGSGAVGIASAYGLRFGVCVSSIDNVTLNPIFSCEYVSNGRTKGLRVSAAKLIRQATTDRLRALGDAWITSNREMYK